MKSVFCRALNFSNSHNSVSEASSSVPSASSRVGCVGHSQKAPAVVSASASSSCHDSVKAHSALHLPMPCWSPTGTLKPQSTTRLKPAGNLLGLPRNLAICMYCHVQPPACLLSLHACAIQHVLLQGWLAWCYAITHCSALVRLPCNVCRCTQYCWACLGPHPLQLAADCCLHAHSCSRVCIKGLNSNPFCSGF